MSAHARHGKITVLCGAFIVKVHSICLQFITTKMGAEGAVIHQWVCNTCVVFHLSFQQRLYLNPARKIQRRDLYFHNHQVFAVHSTESFCIQLYFFSFRRLPYRFPAHKTFLHMQFSLMAANFPLK